MKGLDKDLGVVSTVLCPDLTIGHSKCSVMSHTLWQLFVQERKLSNSKFCNFYCMPVMFCWGVEN